MFADANNLQFVFQNGVLPDVMTPLGILLEKCPCFQVKTLQQQDSGCDLDKMFAIGNKQNYEYQKHFNCYF